VIRGTAPAGNPQAHAHHTRAKPLLQRLFSRRVGAMLVRNTLVSTGTFLLGLFLLWIMVTRGGMNEVVASGIGFIAANTVHYALGRWWIFAGTTRAVGSGYALFLTNSALGLAITMTLYAAFLAFTSLNFLVARVVVSVFAGLAMFVLNAAFNFRQV